MWGSSNLMTQLGRMGQKPSTNQANLAYYQSLLSEQQPQSQGSGWGSTFTPVNYNPELGYAPTPEGYLGRPKRRMPDYFGLNTHANELAAAYNALQGYGPQMVDTNSESGGYEEDFGVVVDPWSGRVSRANNPYGTRNNYVSDALAKAMGSPDGSFYKGYDSYADFSPEARDAAFFEKQIRGEATDGGNYMRRVMAPRLAPQLATEYNANLERFNTAKTGYESAWNQVQDQYMSPTLDAQLRELMPDDGKSFNNAFTTNHDHHINTMNYALKGKGVEDLREIGWTEHDGKKVFYNRRTGHEIKPELFNYRGGKGDGNVTFKLKALNDGQVTFDTNFKKPSKWGNGAWIDVVAPVAMGMLVGGLGGGAIKGAIGGTAGNIAGGAFQGAVGSMASGGDPIKAAVLSAAGSGLGGYVNSGLQGFNLSPDLTNALSNGFTGGVITGLSGGNPLQGAVIAGVGSYANSKVDGLFNPQQQAPNPYSLASGNSGLGLKMPDGPATGLRVGDATLNDWSMFGVPFARGDVWSSIPLRDVGSLGLSGMGGGTGISSNVLGGTGSQVTGEQGKGPSRLSGVGSDLIKGLIQIGLQSAFLGNRSGNSSPSNSSSSGSSSGLSSELGSGGARLGGDNSQPIIQYSGIPDHRPLSGIGVSGNPLLIKPLLWES